MAKDDYYEKLGIEKGASEAEIKSAFRKAARQYHPDVYKGEDREEKFKEYNEAYQVLSDPNKRRQYDQFGSADGFDFGGAGGAGFGGGFEDIFSNLGDIFGGAGFGGFEDMFGGSRSSRRGSRKSRGEDIRVDLSITLDEASKGVEKEISVRRLEKCSTCGGSGSRDGKEPKACNTCGGRGEVRQTRQSFLGAVSTVSACPTCQGEGKIISSPCTACSGSGRATKSKNLNVKIPAGIRNGSKLRLTGEGNIGQRNGSNGDLYVFINVKNHAVFERDGDDLYMKQAVSYSQAALGATVDVKTLFGTVAVKIPAGTQPNTSFRLKAKGMPRLGRSGQGDLYVIISLEVPKNLSNEEKTILEYLASLKGETTEFTKKAGKVKDRLKKLFK